MFQTSGVVSNVTGDRTPPVAGSIDLVSSSVMPDGDGECNYCRRPGCSQLAAFSRATSGPKPWRPGSSSP